MKKYRFFVAFFTITFFAFFSCILTAPQAYAEKSGNDVLRDVAPRPQIEPLKDTEQTDAADYTGNESRDHNVQPSPAEVSVKLNKKLQWFINFDPPSFVDDMYELYEQNHNVLYRAVVGFHIAL